MKRSTATILLATLGVAVFVYARVLRAADTDFPIYFENSVLALKSQSFNRTVYLPITDIVRHLGLGYTDATAIETFTVQGANARLVLAKNSQFILVNDQSILLQNPIRHEEGRWLVPLDFLSQGLSRVAGIEFRYKPGTSRVFAGDVSAAELLMVAQTLGPLTRLTLRAGSPVEIEVQRDAAQRRTLLILKGRPIDPLRERLDFRDRLVQSVAFDDGDGVAKIVVGTSDDVHGVRLNSTDENRVHFIDFVRETALAEAAPPPAPPKLDGPAKPNGIRVIVLDAGHGGMDSGVATGGTLEKDLTLTMARQLRSALQARLEATVLLTRDADVTLTNEARSAVANNNQANLLISLHIGYSENKLDSGSSVFVVRDGFASNLTASGSDDRLFLPWYLAYRTHRQSSGRMAEMLQQNLALALPGWKFPLRGGPIGVLASAAMPAVALEIGNLNNPVNVQALTDAAFQSRLASAIAASVQQFAETRTAGNLDAAAY